MLYCITVHLFTSLFIHNNSLVCAVSLSPSNSATSSTLQSLAHSLPLKFWRVSGHVTNDHISENWPLSLCSTVTDG